MRQTQHIEFSRDVSLDLNLLLRWSKNLLLWESQKPINNC